MKKVTALTIAAAATLFGFSAMARADGANRLNIPSDKWLSVSEVIQKLKTQGYSVTKIEADDGAYEFDATNADGVRVEGHANPATGEILKGYDD